MANIDTLLTDHLDLWTSAIARKSSAGRGRSKKFSLYGIDKLRALILDLAVRGKLVPQDPADEPAANLLERIEAKTSTPTGGKTTSKTKRLSSDVDDEMTRKLPNGWCWGQMANVGDTFIGLTYSPKDVSDSGIPVLRSSNIQEGKIDLADLVRVDIAVKEKLFLKPEDLLICVRNGSKNLVGKCALVPQLAEPMVFGAFMAIFRSPINKYLEVFLRSPLFRRLLEGVETTTINQITQENLKSTILPIPPLSEQHRIVAKVDELMALCDRLEAGTYEAIEAYRLLVTELLATLTASRDAGELAENWARIETHFDTLFVTEDSVDQLKQTVLQLAVMGRLVPQDPKDEPAAELLGRWRRAKQRALENAEDRRIKIAPEPEASPSDLPDHWSVQSFENIFLFIDYRGNTPPKTTSGIPLVTAKNVRMGYLDREPREFVSEATFEKWMTRGFPETGDLFFTTEAPLGNICLNDIDEPFAIAQRLICFKPYGEVNTRFYMLVIMSDLMQRILDNNATGMTARGIKAAKLKPIALPVPPEAEQRRIVAKVDELMDMCDALKARIAGANDAQKQFADAVVANAVA